MTLEEAIKTNKLLTTNLKGALGYEGVAALKLGIEALKRVKWHKEQHLDGYYEPLPGETKGDINEPS